MQLFTVKQHDKGGKRWMHQEESLAPASGRRVSKSKGTSGWRVGRSVVEGLSRKPGEMRGRLARYSTYHHPAAVSV